MKAGERLSFAAQVKEELASVCVKNECCRLAQLYGLLEGGHAFSRQEISLQTEHETVARLYREQIEALLGPSAASQQTLSRRGGLYVVRVPAPADREALLRQFGHDHESLSLRLNRANFVCEQCAAAYVRGTFLACGSVTNPQMGYHLEFTLPHYNLSQDFRHVLTEWGLSGKYLCRKGTHVIYFKESEQIEDCLTGMGATGACLELMNVKMIKSIRNQTNRVANCETANIDKQVAAAAQHREAIDRLEKSGRLAQLPEDWQELALLRRENPDASLRELSELLSYPLSRSGINHRLRRLIELAAEE